MIDIAANAGQGTGVFSSVPQNLSPGDFSLLLTRESNKYQGMPLRVLIAYIKRDGNKLTGKVVRYAEKFRLLYKDEILSRPAGRVLENFSFLAGVGETAIDYGIFPWKKGEAIKAVKFCFDLRLADNNRGYTNEVDYVYKRILGAIKTQNPFELRMFKGVECYIIPRDYVISKICRVDYYQPLVQYLKMQKLILVDRKGEPYKNVSDKNGKRISSSLQLIKERIESPEEVDVADIENSIGPLFI